MKAAIIIFLVLAAVLSIFTLVVVTIDLVTQSKSKKGGSANSSDGN